MDFVLKRLQIVAHLGDEEARDVEASQAQWAALRTCALDINLDLWGEPSHLPGYLVACLTRQPGDERLVSVGESADAFHGARQQKAQRALLVGAEDFGEFFRTRARRQAKLHEPRLVTRAAALNQDRRRELRREEARAHGAALELQLVEREPHVHALPAFGVAAIQNGVYPRPEGERTQTKD